MYPKIAAILGILTLSLTACSKDDANSNDENQIADDSIALSQAEFKTVIDTDAFSGTFDSLISDFMMNNGASGKSSFTDCFTTESTGTGYSMTFDNCSLDGSTENLNGVIEVVNRSTTPNDIQFDVTWTNFSIGDSKLSGTRDYSLTKYINPFKYSFKIISDIEITKADNSVIKEEGEKTVGFVIDDSNNSITYSVSGYWTLNNPDGTSYVMQVVLPLVSDNICGFITHGSIDISTEDDITQIGFGDGSCDNIAATIVDNPSDTPVKFTL